MIRFEFKANQRDPRREGLYLPLDTTKPEQVRFNLPVRFQVDGVELFEAVDYDRTVFVCSVEQEVLGKADMPDRRSPWVVTDIADLVRNGIKQARKACEGKTAIYHLTSGGSLQFIPTGHGVEITCSLSQRSAHASCEELLAAFTAFSEAVSQFYSENGVHF